MQYEQATWRIRVANGSYVEVSIKGRDSSRDCAQPSELIRTARILNEVGRSLKSITDRWGQGRERRTEGEPVTALSRIARYIRRVENPPASDHLRDYNNVLRVNAAAAKLAPALYVAISEVVHGSEQAPWISLHPALKHSWIQRAERAIRAVR